MEDFCKLSQKLDAKIDALSNAETFNKGVNLNYTPFNREDKVVNFNVINNLKNYANKYKAAVEKSHDIDLSETTLAYISL